MRQKPVRTTFAVGVLALAVVAAVGACSTQHTKHRSGDKVDTLKIATGPPTFTRNFNPFSPTSKKGPGINHFYEPLVRVDSTDANKVKPWLAKSFHYSDGGKTLTFKLRRDVKFSDGKPLTAQDVKYTLELPDKTKGLGAAPVHNLKNVTTPNKHTAVVHYSKPELHDVSNYGDDPRLIVPAHVWNKHDPKKWTNKNPVGTGPFRLEAFGPQSIKLKSHHNYWHGHFHGVKHVEIKAFGSEESGKQMILKNKATWAGMSWQDYKDQFVQENKHNHYHRYPDGSSLGLRFNEAKAPTDNVHIRRALYASLDSTTLIKLFNDGSPTANPTGLEPKVWGKYQTSDLRRKRHKQNVKEAKSELQTSGYKVRNGKLVKGNKHRRLVLRTNADYAPWKAWASGLRSQWEKTLGLRVRVKQSPDEQLGQSKEDGDFDILFDFLMQGQDIWSVFNDELSSDSYKPVGTRANGDFSRFRNSNVDKLLQRMARSRNHKKLKKNAVKIQHKIIDDVPVGPLFSLDTFGVINSSDWSGWPDPNHPKYYAHIKKTVDNNLTIQNLKPNATK